VILGRRGVEKIVELNLTDAERTLLAKSIQEVRTTMESMEGALL